MRENIIKLIDNDIKNSMYLNCLASRFGMDAAPLTTDNILVILSIMCIQPKEQVLNTYYELVDSINKLKEGEQHQLPHTIFSFLEKCQANIELREANKEPITIGMLQIQYTYLA